MTLEAIGGIGNKKTNRGGFKPEEEEGKKVLPQQNLVLLFMLT